LYLFQVYQEFQIQLTELTVENLLEQFTISKHTGLEKPGRWEVFSYQSSLKHSPLKKPSSTTNTILEATKRPEKLLIQTSAVSPTTSDSQGKAYNLICTSKKGLDGDNPNTVTIQFPTMPGIQVVVRHFGPLRCFDN
jgi:hypothetical protein